MGSGCTQSVLGRSGPIYTFPPAAILGKVVKLQGYACKRIILIAPRWANMPWFWDLVAMSNQIPLCLPNLSNLVSQPFNQTLHRNLSNLNLHAWLPEPQQSRSRASLRQLQHELRLLRGSTRSVYEAKWTIFTKWCLTHQVDFRAPPLKTIADFLAPTLIKSLKGDRFLCPVRALRYYLDRTSDPRQNKELVFVSFKKGFDKDISPVTISSWIKQTVILCYELSSLQEALTLHQVKAHEVRAFAASKAFQSGVSLEQILSDCYWKSHNTFTQFYFEGCGLGWHRAFSFRASGGCPTSPPPTQKWGDM